MVKDRVRGRVRGRVRFGDDYEEGEPPSRTRISSVSKRSTSRVSIATMRASISLPGRTRSFETKRFATEASRQAAHSMAEPRASSKNLPFDVRGAYRFPRPYLEVRKGLRGRVAQTTRAGVELNTERHRRRSRRSRQRTGARDNKHPVFRGRIEDPQR
jgi:hypothetical protein